METKCPHCNKPKIKHYKKWSMTGRGDVTVTMHLFKCPKCENYWRRAG